MFRKLFLSLFVLSLTGTMTFAEDKVMGDWEGSYMADSGESGLLAAQVIAEGSGVYRAVIQLVDEGIQLEITGQKDGNETLFNGKIDVGAELGGTYDVEAKIIDSEFTGRFSGSEATGRIKFQKMDRKSPTLGKKPPDGAIVLFDGTSLKGWQQPKGKPAKWKILKDGSMEVTKGSIVTRQKLGDHKLHVEFRTPYMPDERGQDRGNSGVYVLGRYEVQVLDSYGLEAKDSHCGGIYKIAAPRTNACYPPLSWQTYDITFYAPKYDTEGTKTKPAEITVLHNGMLIHDKVILGRATPGGVDQDETKPGGLFLQDHNNPVRYRNIWAIPLN